MTSTALLESASDGEEKWTWSELHKEFLGLRSKEASLEGNLVDLICDFSVFEIKRLRVGDTLDVRDTISKWYRSIVLQVRDRKLPGGSHVDDAALTADNDDYASVDSSLALLTRPVLRPGSEDGEGSRRKRKWRAAESGCKVYYFVHYMGWDGRWNEWMDADDSERVARAGLRTTAMRKSLGTHQPVTVFLDGQQCCFHRFAGRWGRPPEQFCRTGTVTETLPCPAQDFFLEAMITLPDASSIKVRYDNRLWKHDEHADICMALRCRLVERSLPDKE